MTKLAREELIKQFEFLAEELRLCIKQYEQNDYSVEHETVILQRYKQEYPEYQRADLTEYLTSYGEDEHTLNVQSIKSAIKQIVQIAPQRAFVGQTLEEIGVGIPQPFNPLTKFIDALVPPNTIRTTAYLQWGGDNNAVQSPAPNQNALHVPGITNAVQSTTPNQNALHVPGITLELDDLSLKRRSTIHTLWQPLSKERDLLRCHIQLLQPAMR